MLKFKPINNKKRVCFLLWFVLDQKENLDWLWVSKDLHVRESVDVGVNGEQRGFGVFEGVREGV